MLKHVSCSSLLPVLKEQKFDFHDSVILIRCYVSSGNVVRLPLDPKAIITIEDGERREGGTQGTVKALIDHK